jgi:hypothetical protein
MDERNESYLSEEEKAASGEFNQQPKEEAISQPDDQQVGNPTEAAMTDFINTVDSNSTGNTSVLITIINRVAAANSKDIILAIRDFEDQARLQNPVEKILPLSLPMLEDQVFYSGKIRGIPYEGGVRSAARKAVAADLFARANLYRTEKGM